MTNTDPSSPLSPQYVSPWVNPTDGTPYSPLTNLGATPNPPAPSNIFDVIGKVFGALGRPDFWVRTGIFAAGVGLIIVGIVILVSSSKLAGEVLTAAGSAAKLTPAGAAANVAAGAISNA